MKGAQSIARGVLKTVEEYSARFKCRKFMSLGTVECLARPDAQDKSKQVKVSRQHKLELGLLCPIL